MSKIVKADFVALSAGRLLDGRVPLSARSLPAEARAAFAPGEAGQRDHLRDAAEAAEQMKNKAAAKGYAEGYAEGTTIGYAEGSRQGFAEGYAEGVARAEEETADLVAALQALLAKMDAHKQKELEDNQKALLRLALQMAGKVVCKELSEDNGSFVRLFQKAAAEISGEKHITLTVSGYEADFATMSADYLLGMVRDAERIGIRVDETAPQGTCRIESERILVDAGAQTQLDRLGHALLGDANG